MNQAPIACHYVAKIELFIFAWIEKEKRRKLIVRFHFWVWWRKAYAFFFYLFRHNQLPLRQTNFGYDGFLAQNIILSFSNNWIDLVTFYSIFFCCFGHISIKAAWPIDFFLCWKALFSKDSDEILITFGHFDIKQK